MRPARPRKSAGPLFHDRDEANPVAFIRYRDELLRVPTPVHDLVGLLSAIRGASHLLIGAVRSFASRART